MSPVNLFAVNVRHPFATRNSTIFRTAMPPKRKVAAMHGNAASDTESVSQSQPRAKLAKRTESTSDDAKAPNGQPTNKVLPVTIDFPPRAAGTLRFAAWNVCGLAAAQRKVRFNLFTIEWTSRNRRSRGSNIMWRRKIRISLF
jgi:hypothetical protein